jgi:hypothetical protein
VWEEYGKSGDVLMFDLPSGKPEVRTENSRDKVLECEVSTIVMPPLQTPLNQSKRVKASFTKIVHTIML